MLLLRSFCRNKQLRPNSRAIAMCRVDKNPDRSSPGYDSPKRGALSKSYPMRAWCLGIGLAVAAMACDGRTVQSPVAELIENQDQEQAGPKPPLISTAGEAGYTLTGP